MSDRHAGRHNAAVRAARSLLQKKHRTEQRCFLIEGPLLLRAALDAQARIEHIFISDGVKDDILGPATAGGSDVISVDARTLESLAHTKTPQGIVAVVGFLDRAVSELGSVVPADGRALVLVLPNLSDPGNAGTLIRSAEAFGVHAVCFGPHAVEPYNDKVVRASMGSLFRVPLIRYGEWKEMTAALGQTRLRIVAADASGQDVRTVTLPERIALVVGQESHGLDGVARDDLGTLVAIPQKDGVESLNAGVAGSLLLYECARSQGLGAHAPGRA